MVSPGGEQFDSVLSDNKSSKSGSTVGGVDVRAGGVEVVTGEVEEEVGEVEEAAELEVTDEVVEAVGSLEKPSIPRTG